MVLRLLPRQCSQCPLCPDKYSSQFGGGSQYAYFHEEDETSFQLVDTARTQKTAYQRNRMRFAQVSPEWPLPRPGACVSRDAFNWPRFWAEHVCARWPGALVPAAPL